MNLSNYWWLLPPRVPGDGGPDVCVYAHDAQGLLPHGRARSKASGVCNLFLQSHVCR